MNLKADVIDMNNFELRWRFTDDNYNVLPPEDLAKIHPLNEKGTKKINDIIDRIQFRKNYQLNKETFTSITELDIRNLSESNVKKWLENLNIEIDQNVFLFWDSYIAATTNWKIFLNYYDDFYYPVSDDLTIFDKSLEWALYFFHEEIVYFGKK